MVGTQPVLLPLQSTTPSWLASPPAVPPFPAGLPANSLLATTVPAVHSVERLQGATIQSLYPTTLAALVVGTLNLIAL